MEREYIAFISYRHVHLDAAVAESLHTLIEQYRIPRALRKRKRKRLGLVFRDQEELPVSSDLSADICSALDHAEYLIVICSPEAVESQWVMREIDYFLKYHDHTKVLTVLVNGEPESAFPKMLTHIIDPISGSMKEIEPLAVDVRAKNRTGALKNLRKKLNKLIAALIGCSYDELVMREQRRKRRRIVAVATVALTVALSFTGMLLVKNQQINQKNKELQETNLQLEQRGVELAEQKAAVQLRESELLTATAEEALAAGKRATAIEMAIRALPREGDMDRPYYAPAERTLISALDIFGAHYDETHLLTDTVVEQTTVISDYQISADGNRLATVDAYGMLRCYDTMTAELVWQIQIPEREGHSTSGDVPKLFALHDGGDFIAYYPGTLAAYSTETGQLLWEVDVSDTEEGCVFLSRDQSVVGVITEDIDGEHNLNNLIAGESLDPYVYDFALKVISTETGQLLHQITLGDNIPELVWSFSETSAQPSAGAFSEDNQFFAGSYLEKTDNGRVLRYYLVDLAAKAVEILHSQEYSEYSGEPVIAMRFIDDGASLAVIRNGTEDDVCVMAEKFDLQNKTLLWQTPSPPLEEGAYYSRWSSAKHALITSKETPVFYENRAYLFDMQDGTVKASEPIADGVVYMEPALELFFGYVRRDGYAALAWVNSSGIYDSSYFSATASLGAVSMARFWNGGCFQVQLDGSSIADISLGSAADGAGFAAVVPQDDPYSVVIKRAQSLDILPQPVEIGFPEGTDTLYGSFYTAPYGDDRVVIGSFHESGRSLTAGGDKTDAAFVLDANTLEPTDTFTYEPISSDYIHFLPDGSGYLLTLPSELSLYRSTDRQTVILAENEEVTLAQAGELRYFTYKYAHTAARRQSDDKLIAVRCGGDTLELWLNGEKQPAVALPEGLRWSIHRQGETSFDRILEAGENGYILLSHFDSEDQVGISSFAAYDTQTDTWHRFDDPVDGSYFRTYSMGSVTPRFAVVDEDNTVRVYDMARETLIHSFPLQIPANSVKNMEFLLDDTALAVLTAEQLIFFEVESGEVLYRELFMDRASGEISTYVDAVNERLYVVIHDTDVGGLCLDLRSWTKLVNIQGMVCYIPQGNFVLRYTRKDGLTACRLPDTSELVLMGEALILP